LHVEPLGLGAPVDHIVSRAKVVVRVPVLDLGADPAAPVRHLAFEVVLVAQIPGYVRERSEPKPIIDGVSGHQALSHIVKACNWNQMLFPCVQGGNRMRATLWYTMTLVIGVLAVGVAVVFACCLSITITTPSAGGKSTFSSSPKNISCQCDTTGPCTVTWSSEDIAGVTESWPSGSTGTSVTLRLTTLPSDNDEFGDIWVKATDGAVSHTHHFDLFFPEEATSHPGGGTPNWYYYWSQVESVHYGTHNYDPGSAASYTDFVGGAWRSYIGTDANESAAAGCWNAEGIDFFAHMCRH